MPSGLTLWLDGDSNVVKPVDNTKSKDPLLNTTKASSATQDGLPGLGNDPFSDSTPCSKQIAIIDLDIENSDEQACNQGAPGSQKKPWDLFANDTAGKRDDAFARLLNRPSSASKTKAAQKRGTSSARKPSAPSSWDPFAVEDGKKKHSTNAFSKLLSSKQGGATSTSSSGGRKRKRSPASPSSSDAKAAKSTRFCECPVCGDWVIIDLCSKHLDTECRGPSSKTNRGSSTVDASRSPSTPSSTAITATKTPLSFKRPPATVTPSDTSTSPGSLKRMPRKATVCTEATVHSNIHPKATAIVASSKTSPCAKRQHGAGLAGQRTLTSADFVGASDEAYRPRTDVTPIRSPSTVATRLKSPRTLSGRATRDSAPVTACPVCGKHVRADLCSLHLDTDCSGVGPASPASDKDRAAGSGEIGKDEEVMGLNISSKDTEAEEEGGRRGKLDAVRAGGLEALAAELTCPVCLCLFEDAHVLPCSHRFCFECINSCFLSSKKQECPLCKVPAWKRDLKRDVPLQNILLAYRRMTT